MNVIEILRKVLGVYALLLCITGTLGNSFNLFIILRTNLKETATFVLLGFLCLIDALSLYFWNLDHFLNAFFEIDRKNSCIFWCRFDTFFAFVSLQSSAFFLVIRVEYWKKTHFKILLILFLKGNYFIWQIYVC
jgi:hypothetical protein